MTNVFQPLLTISVAPPNHRFIDAIHHARYKQKHRTVPPAQDLPKGGTEIY